MNTSYNHGDHDLDRDVTLGREELELALASVRDGRSVHISGAEKLGKTTLLRLLERRLMASRDAVVVYFDMHTLDELDPRLLWRTLEDALDRAVEAQLEPAEERGGPTIQVRADPSPFHMFCSRVRQVSRRLLLGPGEPRLVFLLDECERLLSFGAPGLLIGNLRALTSLDGAPIRPQLVVAGFRGLHDFEMPDRTSPLNTFDAISLRPLGALRASSAYAPLLAEIPPVDHADLVGWLDHQTGGHPFVVQVLCSSLQRGHRRLADSDWEDWDDLVAPSDEAQLGRVFKRWAAMLTQVPGAEQALRQLVDGGELPQSKVQRRVVDFLCYSGLVSRQGRLLSAPVWRFNRWWRAESRTGSVPARPQGRLPEKADVVIVNALYDEYAELIKVREGALDPQWTEARGPGGYTTSYCRFQGLGGQVFLVVATWAPGMGRENAQSSADLLVSELQPRVLAMSGICAGRRGDVALGDVIVADRLWSIDAGKREVIQLEGKTVETFKADLLQYQLRAPWKQRADRLAGALDPASLPWVASRPEPSLERQGDWILGVLLAGGEPDQHPAKRDACPSWEAALKRLWKLEMVQDDSLELTEKGRKRARRNRSLHPDGLPPEPGFRVHVAPIGTGAAVEVDEGLFPRLSSSMRKILGVEMEASGLGALGRIREIDVVVAKAVSDFADHDKDDRYRAFAARASAEVLLMLLREVVGEAGVSP